MEPADVECPVCGFLAELRKTYRDPHLGAEMAIVTCRGDKHYVGIPISQVRKWMSDPAPTTV